ncbi:MAG: UDP-N-acetylglucosamine 2-epimerase (non-hydrolyzing) [Devosia sp.]|nr:UDP-N-acetylglucosamine 2-epimerase (non-hydrolyzing) [Devosia sp.]MBO9591142.1 UDP-N-acetylglucosamine 2-epimerase (non-hydrolyzing) [Devosia sp.]
MRVLVLCGTRPEVIKMAPVVMELRQTPGIEPILCFTGQHRSMAEMAMQVFGLTPDIDLNVMKHGQSLEGLTASLLSSLGAVLEEKKPDLILVQGDTTSAMVGALAGFYRNIRVGHVEAGLRTGNMKHPWPEEGNRRIVGLLAWRHYTPTDVATGNLLREGVEASRIVQTGNPVVDALQWVKKRIDVTSADQARMMEKFGSLGVGHKIVLVTGHRRESFGGNFESICRAIREIASRSDTTVIYPVHLNPNVREPVNRILGGVPNVHLLEPLAYDEFVFLMGRATVILTDSGGVQEEAPSLGKPVLVMRETSERREAIDAGVAKLVGTSFEQIVRETTLLLDDPQAYAAMAHVSNPFGDGSASKKIAEDLLRNAVNP